MAHLVPEYFKIEKVEKVDEMSDEVLTCLDLHLEWNLSKTLEMSISPIEDSMIHHEGNLK